MHDYTIETDRLILRSLKIEDGLLIESGSIGPESERKDYWAFGYNFRYNCWGNGYATKAAKELDWKAEFTLEEMCRDSWKWQENNPNGYTD